MQKPSYICAMQVKNVFNSNKELLIWVAALGYIYFMPLQNNFSFCFFKLMGITFCPGCGIGRAMHLVMHGQINYSFSFHYFGVPALLIILYRIINLLTKKQSYTLKTNK